MKKIFTFLIGAFICTMGWSQGKTGEVVKATTPPTIDGVADAVWATANKYNITSNFQTEVPTVGAEGTTYFKALWDDNGMYILVVVNDDAWYPSWASTTETSGASYNYDNLELYFDTNYILEDGKGGQTSTTGNRQIAPAVPNPATVTGGIDGAKQTTTVQGGVVSYAYKVTNPAYSAEYFVPWESIPDKDKILFDKTNTMGFDVTVIDRDPSDTARKRVNWSNAGKINENWNNMDDAGHLTFDGAEPLVYIDYINIAAGQKITADNGVLPIAYTLVPADATYKKLSWSIVAGGTGLASIDVDGKLTAIKDGTILVKAVSTDGGWSESDVVTITISGQKIGKNDIWNSLNKIKNWDFNSGTTSWGSWVDTGAANGLADQKAPAIVDGVSVQVGKKSADGNFWHYQYFQNNMGCEPNVPYTFKFKAWASADNTPAQVDFEDDNNSYARYGTSADANAIGGKTEWDLVLMTTPQWYTMKIDAFDQIKDNTQQQVQFAFSGADATIYLDSVLLIKDADYKLTSRQMAVNSMKVYPNPVGNAGELTVSLSQAKGMVGIYNSVGQKMMEKVATSTTVKFNVTSLRKGMYFVRLSDGTSQKFMK